MTAKDDLHSGVRRHMKPGYQNILSRTLSTAAGDRTLKDRGKLMFHKYGRHILGYLRVVLTRIKIYEPPTMDEVTAQGAVLCRDFIYQRLKKQNLLSLKLELHPSAARSSEVAMEIDSLATELEKQFPHLYHNICRQINTVMSSDYLAKATFRNIADAMFSEDHVTWGKIVALFSIAGALSAECVQQGHPEFVRSIADVFTDATSTYLAVFIVKQGGWGDITRVFRTTKETSTLWAVTGIGAMLGFTATLVTSLNAL